MSYFVALHSFGSIAHDCLARSKKHFAGNEHPCGGANSLSSSMALLQCQTFLGVTKNFDFVSARDCTSQAHWSFDEAVCHVNIALRAVGAHHGAGEVS
jgi:hypothetical protein